MPRILPVAIVLLCALALGCSGDDDGEPAATTTAQATGAPTQLSEATSLPDVSPVASPTPEERPLVESVGPVVPLVLESNQKPEALPPELFVYDVEREAEILRESETYFRMWLAANAGIVREGGGDFYRYDQEATAWQRFNLGTGGLSASFSGDGARGAVGVRSSIWLLDFEAGTQQELKVNALLGSWSPDARRLLLFIRAQPEGLSHYAVVSVDDPASAAHLLLGASPNADAQHSEHWLDQDHVMMVSEKTNLLQVYEVSAATPQLVLEETVESDRVVASPDGRLVAVAAVNSGRDEVVVYQLSPFVEIARIEGATLGQYFAVDRGVWSADSNRLLTRQAACSDDESLAVYDIATGQSTELASGFGYMYRFGFSPDGRWVAFTTHPTNAHVVSADGGAPAEQVTDNVAANFQAAWTADSILVAFPINEGGGYDICLGN